MLKPLCTCRPDLGTGLLLGVLLTAFLLSPSPVLAQDDCQQELAAAEAQYQEGDFDAAISTVSPCLERGNYTRDEAVAAYRLLALAYLNKGEVGEARINIVRLLNLAPDYEADPVEDPPSYTSLVRSARQETLPDGQTECRQELATAEPLYRQGDFDAAISAVSPCLERGNYTRDEAVAAYRLLALAYLNKGEVGQARVNIVKLLNLVPDYEADPVEDPPPYTSLVSFVKQQLQPSSEQALAQEEGEEEPSEPEDRGARTWFSGRRTWLAVGGGLLTAGLVVLLAQGGGGTSGGGGPSLPPPPPLP